MRAPRTSRPAAVPLASASARSSSSSSPLSSPPAATSRFFDDAPRRSSRILRTVGGAGRGQDGTKEAKMEDEDDDGHDSDASEDDGDYKDTVEVDIEDVLGPRKRRRVQPTAQPTRRRGASATATSATATVKPESLSSPPRRARKPAKPAKPTTPSATPPPGWHELYTTVQHMRAPGGAAWGAPVDTMGCERLADGLETATPAQQRFHILVGLMLSSQTKDTVTAAVVQTLKMQLPDVDGGPDQRGSPEPTDSGAAAATLPRKQRLTVGNILHADAAELNRLIWPVGFHNNKTRYLQQTAAILRAQHADDVPATLAGLVALPGVGPKMAYLCLSAAWGRDEGIGVDVHVHRLSNLWGWNATRTPEETRRALEAWLPRDRWREVNPLLVGFGQTVCLPVGRRCGVCDLGDKGLCRAADPKKVDEGRALRNLRRVKNEGGGEEVVVKRLAEELDDEVKHEDGGVVVKKEEEAID